MSADYVAPEEPLLGLATTRQLLEELEVRFEIPTRDPVTMQTIRRLLQQLPDDVLDYRTVDGDL